MPPERGDQAVRDRILAFLSAHHTLTLATEYQGRPWANALFYVNEGFTLYFISDPKTRHADHLRNNPHVAATIQEDQGDWRALKGVQLEGTCRTLTRATDTAHALGLYVNKYAFLGDLLHAPKEIAAAMAKVRFHQIAPTWIRLTDNARGFGFKEEITFEEGK